MNPRALFRSDVEEFVRESLQLIFLHCLDHNYSGEFQTFLFFCILKPQRESLWLKRYFQLVDLDFISVPFWMSCAVLQTLLRRAVGRCSSIYHTVTSPCDRPLVVSFHLCPLRLLLSISLTILNG